MAGKCPRVTKRPLRYWIFSKNKWLQLLVTATAVAVVLANLLPLEMQKRIVNEAINLGQIDLLVRYCIIYLASVIAASTLKFLINILQNAIAQSAIHAMREAVYRHILTLPLHLYRKTQPGLVVSALTTELAAAGAFVGMAVAVPATNLLMLFSFAGYLLWLNPLLAILSLGISPLVLLVVPFLQKRVNHHNRRRVDATRRMSSKVGETVEGIQEIQANAAYTFEGKKFSQLSENLRSVRITWNLYRQAVKRVSSLFTNFSRFMVFAVGGYLAINGRLELGALVAFLSAQDKLYDPWKELIQWYQAYQTAAVTYHRTMAYFDIKPDYPLVPQSREIYALAGNIEVENLDFATREGVQILSNIRLKLDHGEHLAIVGFSGSGKSTLVECIAQLRPATRGEISIDRKSVSQLSKTDVAQAVGFVSQKPSIFEGSLAENLLYALLAASEWTPAKERRPLPSLDDQILVLQQTGLFGDVLRFGLDTILDKSDPTQMVEQILEMRRAFRQEFKDELSGIVEFYDPDRYLQGSSVAENLVFGESLEKCFEIDDLAENSQFIKSLEAAGLINPLLRLGVHLIEASVRRHDSRSAANSRTGTEMIPLTAATDYKRILHQAKRRKPYMLKGKTRTQVLEVALNFIPERHRLLDPPAHLYDRILEARQRIREDACRADPACPSSCRRTNYLYSQSILINIIFGKLKNQTPADRERLDTLVRRVLIRKGLLEDIVALGMQYQVGSKGKNLSGGQQQKLAIGRVLLKRPPILIMDEATSGLDNESQARIQRLLEDQWRGRSTLIWVVHRLDTIRNYDKVAVMKAGRILETGTYEELMKAEGALFDLIDAQQ